MKQTGFTLIELLAVIVILAIIALIATPMILGVIDSAKKGAVESSALGYLESVENTALTEMVENTGYTLTPGTFRVADLKSNYKGDGPSKGTITISEQLRIIGAKLCINDYYIVYDGTQAKVDTSKSCSDIDESEIGTP